MSTNKISENLINVLFHGAAKKFEHQLERSKKILKTECLKELSRHKYKVQVATNLKNNAILKYKKVEEPLQKVIKVLDKNGFNLISASLARSRFLLSIQKGDKYYAGILSFAPKGSITITLFANNHPAKMNWRTAIFSVKYKPRKQGGGDVVQRNTFIRGVMNSMEVINETHDS